MVSKMGIQLIHVFGQLSSYIVSPLNYSSYSETITGCFNLYFPWFTKLWQLIIDMLPSTIQTLISIFVGRNALESNLLNLYIDYFAFNCSFDGWLRSSSRRSPRANYLGCSE